MHSNFRWFSHVAKPHAVTLKGTADIQTQQDNDVLHDMPGCAKAEGALLKQCKQPGPCSTDCSGTYREMPQLTYQTYQPDLQQEAP